MDLLAFFASRVAGRSGYSRLLSTADLEAGLAPAGTYVLPSWEQTALSDQPEKVLVCGWGETAFMCRRVGVGSPSDPKSTLQILC